jgi:hypothetical protein
LLDAEQANLLAAQAWCDRASDGIAQGLDLANALRRYWIVIGLYVLGQQCFRDALARWLTHLPSRALAMALFGLGQLCNLRVSWTKPVAWRSRPSPFAECSMSLLC